AGEGDAGRRGATGGCGRISLDPVSRGATCARRGHYATSRRRDVHCGPRAARARFASAGRLTELYSHGELPLWPHATHADHVTGVALSQDPAQVARVVQLFVVDVRDDVTLATARPVRRRVGGNVEHDRAAGDRQPELLRYNRVDFAVLDAKQCTSYGSAGCDLVGDVAREIDRYGEAEACERPLPRHLADCRRIDADHLAARVEQRPTRVSRIDGGIGLDQLLVAEAERPVHRAQHTRRYGTLDADRVADRDGRLAHLQCIRVAEDGVREILAGDVEYCDVDGLRDAEHAGVDVVTVRQRDAYVAGASDHVRVRDDETVGAYDDAGTRAGGRADTDDCRCDLSHDVDQQRLTRCELRLLLNGDVAVGLLCGSAVARNEQSGQQRTPSPELHGTLRCSHRQGTQHDRCLTAASRPRCGRVRR